MPIWSREGFFHPAPFKRSAIHCTAPDVDSLYHMTERGGCWHQHSCRQSGAKTTCFCFLYFYTPTHLFISIVFTQGWRQLTAWASRDDRTGRAEMRTNVYFSLLFHLPTHLSLSIIFDMCVFAVVIILTPLVEACSRQSMMPRPQPPPPAPVFHLPLMMPPHRSSFRRSNFGPAATHAAVEDE